MAPRSKVIRSCSHAVIVALIVGTVLNLINQGDAIFGAGNIDAAKIVLTYVVPFFVSAHGAFSVGARTAAHAGAGGPDGASA